MARKIFGDDEGFAHLGGGSNTAFIEAGIGNTKTIVGTVRKILHDEDDNSLGAVNVSISTNEGHIEHIIAYPLGMHAFTCPLPNEKVSCVQDQGNGKWYYTGILANEYNINHMLNGSIQAQRINPDGTNTFYTGKHFKSHPDSARAINIFEGDNILQSRNGASLRFSSSQESSKAPWRFSSKGETTPIIILRTGALPIENMYYDYASLYLTTDQEMSITLPTDLPDGIDNNTYGRAQFIGFADRVILGSRSDDIIFSSGATIQLLTRNWHHDVDVVLDQFKSMGEVIDKLIDVVNDIATTSTTDTFIVAGTPLTTTPSVQAGRYASMVSKLVELKQTLTTTNNNIQSLEQN
tara:strand:- start:1475 stop:2527 length:1053 start_codon:yes stop_codon:yes gene_type:complete